MNIKIPFIVSLFLLLLTLSSTLAASTPTQPGALRVDVYSDTAAELFWERSMDDGRIHGYEISFNGTVVASLDASSYFTSTLELGRSYSVAVTAIDDEGNKSEPAALTFTGGEQDGVGSGPASPAELRAEVYSSTAIELFWMRDTTARLMYEISIDDSLVFTNDGTSFFTDDLAAGQRYSFSVVAVDAIGNRSEPATVVAETAGGSGIGMPIDGPSMPANVRFARYSSTAAELFWDRSPARENVASTEISRDGVVIGATDGTSYFDDTRDPHVNYNYGVTFIDTQGQRSITTELITSQPLPIINRDNHIEIVAEALPVYSGERYNALLIDSLDVIGEFLSDVNFEFPETHVCVNGGTAFFDSSPLEIAFSDCMIGEAIYTGNYSFQPGNSDSVSSRDGLTIETLSGVTLQFNGSLQFTRNADFYRTFEVDVQLARSDGAFVLEDANTQFNFAHLGRGGGGPNFIALFKGTFDFRAPGTGGELVSAATLSEFGYSEPFDTHEENWNYRTGVLQLIATDGSELILDADTGDDSTVSIQLNNSQGTEEFLQPWSLWQSVLRRVPGIRQ